MALNGIIFTAPLDGESFIKLSQLSGWSTADVGSKLVVRRWPTSGEGIEIAGLFGGRPQRESRI